YEPHRVVDAHEPTVTGDAFERGRPIGRVAVLDVHVLHLRHAHSSFSSVSPGSLPLSYFEAAPSLLSGSVDPVASYASSSSSASAGSSTFEVSLPTRATL